MSFRVNPKGVVIVVVVVIGGGSGRGGDAEGQQGLGSLLKS